MTKYTFLITVPATNAAPVNFATAAIAAGAVLPGSTASIYSASYLPCAKISVKMAPGATGEGYVGGSATNHTGGGTDYYLPPGSSTVAGASTDINSFRDSNVLELAQFNAHGSNAGDLIEVTYYQA